MELAPFIEHTALKATVTACQIETLCAEAIRYRFAGVCVPPSYVTLAKERLQESPQRLVTVVGFPLGSNRSSVKAAEARAAIEDGADEIDMVGHIGFATSGDWARVTSDVVAVREAMAMTVPLKVILETGYFEQSALERFAEAALSGGADFLKTSTGMGPRGASVEDVTLLSRVAAGRAQVKASGGIKTVEGARALVKAGASRLGTSSGTALVR